MALAQAACTPSQRAFGGIDTPLNVPHTRSQVHKTASVSTAFVRCGRAPVRTGGGDQGAAAHSGVPASVAQGLRGADRTALATPPADSDKPIACGMTAPEWRALLRLPAKPVLDENVLAPLVAIMAAVASSAKRALWEEDELLAPPDGGYRCGRPKSSKDVCFAVLLCT